MASIPNRRARLAPVACAALALATACERTPSRNDDRAELDAGASASASAASGAASSASVPRPAPFTEKALLDHVRFLTAPEQHGRRAGSADEARVAAYVASVFERAGATPLPGGAREQPVPVERLGPGVTSRNVFGVIASAHARLGGEYVFVGAHYDHLGVKKGATYPGAEDNASGVAVLLELAGALAARRAELGRSVVLVAFGAEEVGLVGSRHYVANPLVPLEATAFMVNIDMVGRRLLDKASLAGARKAANIRDADALAIEGTRGRPALRAIVDRAFGAAGLQAVVAEDFTGSFAALLEAQTRGRSDHSSFERAGVPALFFCSGEFDEYHAPGDVLAKLVPELMVRRADAMLAIVLALSHAPRLRAPGAPAPLEASGALVTAPVGGVASGRGR